MNATAETLETQSLSQLPIETRQVRFDYTDIVEPYFYKGNPLTSAYLVALSTLFPTGEVEFINSVKEYEHLVTDEKLKKEIQSFCYQEAHHALQHKYINKQFDRCGYETKKAETRIGKIFQKRIDNWSNRKRLMHTVAAEHFTATLSHYALAHPNMSEPLPPSFRNLFLWHSLEEVEHKSVAFDVYTHCIGDMKRLRRFYIYYSLLEFPAMMFRLTRFLVKGGNRKSTWRERKEFMQFLFGKDGMISSSIPLFAKFMKKDFHPWSYDNSSLVKEHKERLAPYFVNA